MEELARISRLKSSLYSAFLVGIAVTASVGMGLFERLDLVTHDLALRTQKIPSEGPKIVVIGITRRDAEDERLGEYPWSREEYARAPAQLEKAGAAALSVADAGEEIRRNRGTQFSPDVADAFLRYLEETRTAESELTTVGGRHDGA